MSLQKQIYNVELQHLDIQETRQDCPLEASTEYWFWYGVDYNCDGTDAIINDPVVLKVPGNLFFEFTKPNDSLPIYLHTITP